jgi:hypothetical protein
MTKADAIAAAEVLLGKEQTNLAAWTVVFANAITNYETALAAPAQAQSNTTSETHAFIAAVLAATDDLDTAEKMVQLFNGRVKEARRQLDAANARTI